MKAPAVGVLAVFALLTGGIVTWRVLDREKANEEGRHTGPVLEWTEVDPGFASEYVGFLESLGDGRVIVTTTDYDDSGWIVTRRRVLVTVNGIDWAEVPMPADISPTTYDLSGDRWIVAGYGASDRTSRFVNAPWAADGELEVTDPWGPPRQQVFFSDDQGANWVELQINYSSGQQDAPADDDNTPFITVALALGDHMVVVVQSENTESVPVVSTPGDSGGWEVTNDENPLAQVFASDGGMFEEVAAYEGWISGFPFAASLSTPDGFTLGLLREVNGRHQSVELTSPDGRNWSEVTLARTLALADRKPLARMDRSGARPGTATRYASDEPTTRESSRLPRCPAISWCSP